MGLADHRAASVLQNISVSALISHHLCVLFLLLLLVTGHRDVGPDRYLDAGAGEDGSCRGRAGGVQLRGLARRESAASVGGLVWM